MHPLPSFELHLDIENENEPLLPLIAHHCSLSNSEIKQAITKGCLWLTRTKKTQRLRRLKKALHSGDKIHFYYNSDILSHVPPTAILIKDLDDYSVWFKPYGMLSQGSKWSDHCTIARWAETHLMPQRPAFIVHRLDRAASGLIIVAHSKKAVRALTKMFETHELDKHYQVILCGEHQQRPQPDSINLPIDDKKAQSHFTQLSYHQALNISLVKVIIESGRKHQIRKHAQSIGMPVLGDRLYGSDCVHPLAQSTDIDLQLCAVKLSFVCPLTGEKQQFNLPPELVPSIEKVMTKLN